MTASYRCAGAAIAVLLLLQILWHAWLLPPDAAPVWLITAFFLLPILPSAWLLFRHDRHAAFWGAVAALFYFCHGLMEAWAAPNERVPALIEAGLSVVLIVSASWDGLRARFDKRRTLPPQ